MRSATASIVQTKSTANNKTPQRHHQQHQPFSASKTTVSKTASVNSNSKKMPDKSASASKSNSQLHKRSASFHYPDGSSRVTHSVYSSEEDFNDDDDDDEEPRLYEVNDDELFLAYDSSGVVTPRRFNKRSPPRGTGSTSSGTASGSKLEALDNLVISTIFSVSTKLCVLSSKLVKSVQEKTDDREEEAMLQTLVSRVFINFSATTQIFCEINFDQSWRSQKLAAAF